QSGVDFLIDAVHQYGADLTLVPTGPLTNLAEALEKAPDIASTIGNVTLMGGALTVPGNVSHYAEANINQDAEAANAVFTSTMP
ncbi:nucleoside hydrolase, partial [Klebsiella pneumoniae]|nr:nucleoside hydrolase [Klebsiella pneumoniae]